MISLKFAKPIFFPFQPDYKAPTKEIKYTPINFNVQVVKGGITNQLYRCRWDEVTSHSLLIRVYGVKSEVVIDRERDDLVVRALSRLKFGPKIWGSANGCRLEEWLEGARPLETPEMSTKHFITMIAERLGQMHSLDIPLNKESQLFVTLKAWFKTVQEIHFDPVKEQEKYEQFLKIDLNQLGKDLNEFKKLVEAKKYPVVFSHNDLLNGNIMYTETSETIRFIDFEYSTYNYRGFDFANHFCECCGFECDWKLFPTEQHQKLFITHYLTKFYESKEKKKLKREIHKDEIDKLYQEIQPLILASHLFWGFWALVQSRYSVIEFDYMSYGSARLQAYNDMKDKYWGYLM